jgi:pimeloyl-ACP methyl ester carboxylesterase
MKKLFTLRNRKPGYWRRLLVALVLELVGTLLLLIWVAIPWYMSDRAAHPPRVLLGSETPTQSGLIYENVRFATADGLALSAWYLPGTNGAAVIILHGSPGNRASHLEQAALLSQHGYSVLMVDQRGHGESEGNIISVTGEDAKAAVRYLVGRNPAHLPRIGMIGASLGCYNALQAAADLPELRAVLCDGVGTIDLSDEPPPATFGDYFLVPFYWTGYQVWRWEGVSGSRTMLQSVQQMGARPVLFITGAQQNEFEALVGRKYFAAASGPKQLWEIPDAGHTGGWNAHKEEYSQKLIAFFDQFLGK